MYKIDLTPQEKQVLELQHRETQSDRIKAILLRSEGWEINQIAQALRVHVSTISRYIKDYVNDKKLEVFKGGSESFLTAEQLKLLDEHLRDNLYHYGYEIAAYIKNTFGIEYSIPGLNKLLHRLGFSYKKPKGRPYKANPEAQAAFIEKYEQIKSTLSDDEKLLFIDASHPSQATKLDFGWIKRGATKEVATTAGRSRLNLVGAIEIANPEQALIKHYEKINAESMGLFLTSLREKYQDCSCLHVILDCAGYHRSEQFKASANRLNIKLHYLPPYSPNLNPIERIWKFMNEKVRNNKFFNSAKDFKEKILGFFEKDLPRLKTELASRITDNFEVLNHAL